MSKTIIIIGLALLGLALVALGVAVGLNQASSPPDTVATLNPFYTSQAQTLQAALTPVTPGNAAGVTPSSTPFLLTPPTPGGPTLTPAPTFTPLPTFTPPPPLVTATPTVPCDKLQFVSDVTVQDGTRFPPDATFTKTWRLKNVGTCTWTTAYALVFSSGNRMSGPSSQALGGSVAPGQTVDISVRLIAPADSGSYTGNWMLRNPAGANFGGGDAASNPFWVKIVVDEDVTTAYDFTLSACSATWKSGGDDELPCPGTRGDQLGFVLIQEHPRRESGTVENEPGLLTVPEHVTDGYIQGRYPYMNMKNGDRFRSVVNCEYDFDDCNVTFQLDYQIEGQDRKILWTFNEKYDGQHYNADIDLSFLAGKRVRFFLRVGTNGSPNGDHALWIAPRIIRFSD